MRKTKALLALGATTVIILAGCVFYIYQKGYLGKRLEFTIHNDLALSPLADQNLTQLAHIHQTCFENVRKKNLIRYLENKQQTTPLTSSPKNVTSYVEKLIEKDRLSHRKNIGQLKELHIAWINNKVAGMYICRDESTIIDHATMIWSVCLDPEYRGQGLGKQIVKDAIEHCKKPGLDLTLVVYKDEPQNIGLYQKLGFEIINPPKDPGEDFNYFYKHLMKYKEPTLENSEKN